MRSDLDLRQNVQKKEEITAFLTGTDITSRYKALRGEDHLFRITHKSPFDSWPLSLPRNLKLVELWEMAFRSTKGRCLSSELQYRNARLPSFQATIGNFLNPDGTVFITPSDHATISNGGSHDMQDICLVKVYDKSSHQLVMSFWEPRNTMRSLGSAIFKYYCAKFARSPATAVDETFVLWTGMANMGDGHRRGTIIDGP